MTCFGFFLVFFLFFFNILVTLRFKILRLKTVALMTKFTNSFLSAESMHTNTIYIRKSKISGDRMHPRLFTLSSLGLLSAQFCCKTHYFGNIIYDLQLNSLYCVHNVMSQGLQPNRGEAR